MTLQTASSDARAARSDLPAMPGDKNSNRGTPADYSGRAAGMLPAEPGADILACGFAMTVAAWIAAYLTRMPIWGQPAPGQITILLMLGMVFCGGFFAARYSTKGIFAALWAGAVSGVLDTLIVLSVAHNSAGTGGAASTAVASAAPAAALWIGGSIVLNTMVAGLGGILGALAPSKRRSRVRWTAIFVLVLAAATMPLITAGGLVTAFGAGLAVPDWPQSYGYNMFLFPLSQMQSASGIFYEHAHRLLGSLVGLTALTLALYLTWAQTRRRGTWLGWAGRMLLRVAALATVVPGIIWFITFLVKIHRRYSMVFVAWLIGIGVAIQGIMGGLRVDEKSIPLATVHGIFAQIIFATMACLAAASLPGFDRLTAAASPELTARPKGVVLPLSLVGALFIQLTLGALVRQKVDSMIVPHVTMAAFVALLAAACGFRAYVQNAPLRPLRRAGLAVLALVSLQLTLGVVALVVRPGPDNKPTTISALFTTAHQANGALLLATSAVLALWTWRLREPAADRATLVAMG